ncbi:MAG: guanylate kinase, partial [Verrucomicrobia bacterium]|nr:guanylate kinase [Verrucomicrobiota bacterium]
MVAKILGNLSHGLVFIVSAPAGTGKTTLVRMLINEFDCVAESVSCTTRKIRPGEIPGRDYFFLTDEEFEEKKKSGDFLEFAEVFGHQYGTSREYVMKSQSTGKHVFLVIDTQGAMRLKKENYPAVYVFLSPPSLEELKQRLCKRQTECPDTIEKRLSWAEQEMEMARHYDYHIVNDNLENAYTILR